MAKKRKNNQLDNFMIKILLFLLLFLLFIMFIAFIGTFYPQIINFVYLAVIGIPAYIIYKFIKKKYNEKQYKAERLKRMQTIDAIRLEFRSNPYEFEKFVAELFGYMGYSTQVTSKSNDGGKDIIMFKDNRKYVVEVKLYDINNKIGREKIQKLHSAMIDSKANGGAFFVTTSDFTKNAEEYAAKYNIKLVNGDKLAKIVQVCVKKNLIPSSTTSTII